MKIRLTLNGKAISATLTDSPTARDFATGEIFTTRYRIEAEALQEAQ